VAGSTFNVPVVVMEFPESGAPRPAPAVTELTDPGTAGIRFNLALSAAEREPALVSVAG